MDFRHLIVTCLFSMLRLSFETQKIKENYAILLQKSPKVCKEKGRTAKNIPITHCKTTATLVQYHCNTVAVSLQTYLQ